MEKFPASPETSWGHTITYATTISLVKLWFMMREISRGISEFPNGVQLHLSCADWKRHFCPEISSYMMVHQGFTLFATWWHAFASLHMVMQMTERMKTCQFLNQLSTSLPTIHRFGC